MEPEKTSEQSLSQMGGNIIANNTSIVIGIIAVLVIIIIYMSTRGEKNPKKKAEESFDEDEGDVQKMIDDINKVQSKE